MMFVHPFKSNVVGRQAALMRQAASVFAPTSTSPLEPAATTSGAVRHSTSPAYKRYLQKQKQQRSKLPLGAYIKPTIPAHEKGIQVPSLSVAKAMPCGFSEMENEPLVVIAEMGNHNARKEVLKRHIMMVDTVDYEEACKTLKKIQEKNRENILLAVLPYKLGIATALVAGIGAIPMVFSQDVAMWFNEAFVTMEIPPPSDLDTRLGK